MSDDFGIRANAFADHLQYPVTAIREIKLLQSLNHVNVVALQEVMVEHNDCFMVFEYLSHDLTGLLNHPSFALTAAHKKHLAKQLFEGLDYLHRRGVLHRDIKAANILISKTGEFEVGGFWTCALLSEVAEAGLHQPRHHHLVPLARVAAR